MVERSTSTIIPNHGHRDRPGSVIANELVKAAQVLCHALLKGTVTLRSGKKLPIAGDTTRLPLADGLTPLQKRMAWNMCFLPRNQAGSQQLRQQMGHAEFGARVVYGDCLFLHASSE